MSRLALFVVLSLLALTPLASADIPRLISLQGRLTDASDNPISSSSNFAFRIYDTPSGGSPLWTEFQTLSPNSLGVFSALLGSVATLNIPFNTSYWLEVQVNSEILSPRQRMGSAGYALRSENPWNATGNNMYTTNAGYVGIGTADPGAKLDVNGNINVSGNIKSSSSILTPQSSPPASPVIGQMYYDSSNNVIKVYNGSIWLMITAAEERLAGGLHTPSQCSASGGTVVTIGSDKICLFNVASCPSTWVQYMQYTTTQSNTCSGSCESCNGCASGSHVFSNTNTIESCTYLGWYGGPILDCYATRTQIACY